MRFHAVIFDLDGTLLNTLDDIGDSVNQILTEYGLPTHPIGDYKHMIGNGAKNLMRRATCEKVAASELDALVEKFRTLYATRYDQKTVKYDGIDDVLDWLDQVKIPYAVFSNKPHDITNRIIRRFFPNRCFTAVYGQQIGIPIKPDPTQVMRILSQLRCSAQEAMFIGDSSVDMETAKNAGVFALGVLWGFRDRDELLAHGADALAKTPADIRRLIVVPDGLGENHKK